MNEDSEKFLVRFPRGMRGRLKELGELRGYTSMNSIIVNCIADHLALYSLWPLDVTPEKKIPFLRPHGRSVFTDEQLGRKYLPMEVTPEEAAFIQESRQLAAGIVNASIQSEDMQRRAETCQEHPGACIALGPGPATLSPLTPSACRTSDQSQAATLLGLSSD